MQSIKNEIFFVSYLTHNGSHIEFIKRSKTLSLHSNIHSHNKHNIKPKTNFTEQLKNEYKD